LFQVWGCPKKTFFLEKCFSCVFGFEKQKEVHDGDVTDGGKEERRGEEHRG
jgi:hypothetical protein